MTNLTLHRHESNAIVLPPPRQCEVRIRAATMNDLKFMDDLQKKHSKMVGFLHRPIFEKRIETGDIVIAESNRVPVGYCMFGDKYLRREELGICYQLNIVPDKQRGLIGATLLKEVFNRSAYGCKLFCCWCAQDLQANHFWESMGFIPLAFRTGSRTAGSKKTPRIHIFWQRRIREGDTETPYWFPSETSGGAVKENRLVLPIPPGTHWSDAKPAILPGMENVNVLPPGEQDKTARKPKEKKAKPVVPVKPSGGLWFAPPPPTPEEKAKMKAEQSAGKREKPPRFKNDPKTVEAVRELRDRYMEQVNVDPAAMLPPSAHGKYEVSRQLEAAPSAMKVAPATNLLEAA